MAFAVLFLGSGRGVWGLGVSSLGFRDKGLEVSRTGCRRI